MRWLLATSPARVPLLLMVLSAASWAGTKHRPEARAWSVGRMEAGLPRARLESQHGRGFTRAGGGENVLRQRLPHQTSDCDWRPASQVTACDDN